MAVNDFYNWNANRAYPFIETESLEATYVYPSGSFTLPKDWILDVGFIWGLDSGFSPADAVRLIAISRSGTTLTFDFAADTVSGYILRFERDIADGFGATDYVNARSVSSSSSSSSSANSDCKQTLGAAVDDVCTAFLVTGDLSDATGLLSDGSTACFDPGIPVEPCRSQALGATFVRSINLANDPRVSVSEGSSSSSSSSIPVEPIVFKRNMTGDLRFKAGYNCSIVIDPGANEILFISEIGAGEGEQCEQPWLNSSSSSSDTTVYCDSVIAAINGVSVRNYQIIAGRGFEITPKPSTHEIDIEFVRYDLLWCASSSSSSSSSSPSSSSSAACLISEEFATDGDELGRYWREVEGDLEVYSGAVRAVCPSSSSSSSSSSSGSACMVTENFALAYESNLGTNWAEVEGDLGVHNQAVCAWPYCPSSSSSSEGSSSSSSEGSSSSSSFEGSSSSSSSEGPSSSSSSSAAPADTMCAPIVLTGLDYTSKPQGTWDMVRAANWWRQYCKNTTTNDGDEIQFKLWMTGGTYTLKMVGATLSTGGKTDIYVDGNVVATFDWYGSTTYNVTKEQTGITVTGDGLKTVRVVLNGKNASSSDYEVRFEMLQFIRTA